MSMNLFSMFDPTITKFNPLLMMGVFATMILTAEFTHFSAKNNLLMLKGMILGLMQKEFGKELQTIKPSFGVKVNGKEKLMFTLLVFVFIVNVSSLFPMIMSSTSHMSFNLPMTVILWSTTISIALKVSWKNFFSHLTPMGSPMALMSFMVLIETVSNVIRPLTLSVRLMANMVAGHLILTLLSSFCMQTSYNVILGGFIMLILGTLELGVSLIQGYVLTLLILLYFKEAF